MFYQCCTQHFPQYLEQQDINIFINGFINENIYRNVLAEANNNRMNNQYNDDYYGKIARQVFILVSNVTVGPLAGGIIRFNYETYVEIINYTVPDDLETIFRNIGWEKDGHKKFWTIYFNYMYLYLLKEQYSYIDTNNIDFNYYLENSEHLRVRDFADEFIGLLRIFNQHDVDILISSWNQLNILEDLYNRWSSRGS